MLNLHSNASCPRTCAMSQGCPVPVGGGLCGETHSLEIVKEFNRLYEEKLAQVDSEAGGDGLQEKLKLQQDWIRNLIQQNEMLVKAVQELEYEATERVQQLEDKLQKSAQCLCEVMKKYREHDFVADILSEPLQKVSCLEDDVRNLLEFIRRVRDKGEWSCDGLCFKNVSEKELLGTKAKYSSEGEKLLEIKEKTVKELTEKVEYFSSFGNVEELCCELKARREECEVLKQQMDDMRQALTEEVASKHDQIVFLKKEVLSYEDRCLQMDKQTAFREDIIRELRKEIKQLKQQHQPIPEKLSPNPIIPPASKNPLVIVNRTLKKQPGTNTTVIYINKEVHKREGEHTSNCNKCKLKLTKTIYTNCKSETDLLNVKNSLKPVKLRSKLSEKPSLGRSKTFVDHTKRILNEIEFEDAFSGRVPVRKRVDYFNSTY